MMLNWIWTGLLFVSILCACLTGRTEELANAVLSGAQSAVELCFATMGMMCFWTGMMHIAEKGGLTQLLAKVLHPILKHLFPDLKPGSRAAGAICMNLTANFLGLGNAATPLGISAMKELKKCDPNCGDEANRSMVLFVVLNTASLQLIPTYMATIRAKYGAQNPFDLLPAVWITSICALLVAVLSAKLFERRKVRG